MNVKCMVDIEKVESKKALRGFIRLPRGLYRGDPNWSPPLWQEERQTYTTKNAILARSDYALYLAHDQGRVAGRILVYVDHNFNSFYQSKVGMFGAFESTDNIEVTAALLRQSERWLRAQGMQIVRGPINPVSECWGFLYSGFSRPAAFMMPYNPPYYNEYIEKLGYAKIKDLFAYEGDAQKGYRIPERFIRFRGTVLARRPQVRARRINTKALMADAEAIWRISNESIRNNWGWVPYEREELESVFRKLKPIADPDAIWIMEDKGRAVGFALGFPDLNCLLRKTKGRLLPFGFITLLTGCKRLRDFRLFGLAVLPEYQGQGLDVLLYMSLFEALAPRGVRLEASYVLEDNLNMLNALKKLGLARTKVYRVYQRDISKQE